jgi:Zn finger protein HypA/HybF involved in hydrogenase expression
VACINCDHTMQGIARDSGIVFFWCPRCGTIKSESSSGESWDAPIYFAEFWQQASAGELAVSIVNGRSNLSELADKAIESGSSIERSRFIPKKVEPPSGLFDLICPKCKYKFKGHPGMRACPKCGASGDLRSDTLPEVTGE